VPSAMEITIKMANPREIFAPRLNVFIFSSS
jgi:hypothetical protein